MTNKKNKQIKIACCQIDIELGNLKKNTNKIIKFIKNAALKNAELIIFPECSLTGYCINSFKEAKKFAQKVKDSKHVKEICELAMQYKIYIIFGLIEYFDNKLYNSAVLICPDGSKKIHRKAHTSFVGIDRFVEQGDTPFIVYDLPIGRIGFYICYDHNFSESARILMLQNVQLICLLTNWSEPAKPIAISLSKVRAFENKIFIACANRVGIERNSKFIGISHIFDPFGNILVKASKKKEEIIFADIELSLATDKKTIINKDEYIDLKNDRRPEFYGIIAQKD